MQVNKGKSSSTTSGNRTVVHCEGDSNSSDNLFYRRVLGESLLKFDFQPLGSSNTLLSYAETELIEDGFCLIDRDFRTGNEVEKLEDKYKIKFLLVHELENLFLNSVYLERLSYLRRGVVVENEIEKIIIAKKVRFLADFLQFRINTHLDKFPRISKLSNTELPKEDELIEVLLSKLNHNYDEVKDKINEIKNQHIEAWKIEFESLDRKFLPGKEIFKELKNKIFNNPPTESAIVKDIALLMEADGFIPPELQSAFDLI